MGLGPDEGFTCVISFRFAQPLSSSATPDPGLGDAGFVRGRVLLGALNPNDWVTWWHTGQPTVPVRWRTGLSGAPIANSLPNDYFGG
jgi:hypothetical protein